MHRILTAAWFPAVFALLQTVRYFAFLAHGYWLASSNQSRFDSLEYIRQDLARPLFTEYDFCDAWRSYTAGQEAVFGLDLPANLAAQLLHAAITGATTCLDLATPEVTSSPPRSCSSSGSFPPSPSGVSLNTDFTVHGAPHSFAPSPSSGYCSFPSASSPQ